MLCHFHCFAHLINGQRHCHPQQEEHGPQPQQPEARTHPHDLQSSRGNTLRNYCAVQLYKTWLVLPKQYTAVTHAYPVWAAQPAACALLSGHAQQGWALLIAFINMSEICLPRDMCATQLTAAMLHVWRCSPWQQDGRPAKS